MLCFYKPPSATKAPDNLQEMYSLIEEKLESVEIALTKTIESQIKTFAVQNQTAIPDLASKVDVTAKDVSADSAGKQINWSASYLHLKKQIQDLCYQWILQVVPLQKVCPQTTCTNQLLASKSVDISNTLSSALAEKKDRSKRQLNLIIHNLDEAASEDAQTRKDQDIQKVSEIFKHLGTKASVNNAV